jgi:hypothetical protein
LYGRQLRFDMSRFASNHRLQARVRTSLSSPH